ncbi:MAG: hypothetical protein A3F84_14975 [Candidatus Handelsmanbacteria bacterium RIFCSPLOWO2_12_FULL_64_10]|uniref:DUF5673 domain-containing protein n=1 Tax=Handelsmanbacteria sp. (strain RIFCSPLOWO2_12_FULL_64_10) TaxID=1817868 RepID=A0A1F6D1Y5_HANXR|nr:MAG: hypothetical protein A3F84_14975 [Candidatus Handelsmanbacteria bacterium RIFCSPLOWO2_12_FULL_64_10]
MQRSGAGLVITWRWFSLKYIFLTVFVLFWDGFLIFWYSMALRSDDWLPILFPIIHVAVGVGLTYSVLAGYLNKTRIQVTPRSLEIEHGPLPWPGKRLEASYVKQLYCKERIQHSRNSTSYSYELRAVTHDGGDRKLLKGLEEAEQALYLEQEIEKFLRIEDRPIRGELER